MVADGSASFHAQEIAAAGARSARAAWRSSARRSAGPSLLLGALVLWFHYGTAVFFEMIVSGIAACF